MARKRVAVLRNENLLMAGVVSVLEAQPQLEVRDINTKSDDLIEQLAAYRPNVVVLEGEDTDLASRVPLESLLQSNPKAIVIALTLKENDIRAYKQQRIVRANAEDLLNIIMRGTARRRNTRKTEVPS